MRAMGVQLEDQGKIIQERIAEEDLVQERVDEEGKKWRKIYFGGGEHCRHWLEQFKELGEVQVEDGRNQSGWSFLSEKMMPWQEVVTPVKTGVQRFNNRLNALDSGWSSFRT